MDSRQKLIDARTNIQAPGDAKRIEKRKARGRLTARERLEMLLDPGSLREIGAYVEHTCRDFGLEKKRYAGDGVITCQGTINGRPVCAFAQDFTVLGGSLGLMHARKITNLLDTAVRIGTPVIGLNDSGGARIQEGVSSLAGYAEIFYRNVRASGVVPQISAIMGPCAGGAVYSPGLNDFIIMSEDGGYMFLTGPDVIRAVTGEETDFDSLGGAGVHSSKSGVAHLVSADDQETLETIRDLLSYLPQNNLEDPPYIESDDSPDRSINGIGDIVPDSPNSPYDMHKIVEMVVDEDSFMEIHSAFAQNIITGFARLAGESVGIIANNPSHMAGVLDVNSSDKASRFIRTCDAFNIPLISFVDVPGFMPGTDQEHGGIIRHGAKLLYAYSEATVPMLTVIIRKAYGGAYCVMSSKHLGADTVLAWPGAEIAVMGAEGACNIVFRREISGSSDPENTRQKLVEEYRDNFANPWVAAKLGFIDDVILPEETRSRLCDALFISRGKREVNPSRKHGNFPA